MNMRDKIACAMVGESSVVLVGGTPAIAAWVPSPAITLCYCPAGNNPMLCA